MTRLQKAALTTVAMIAATTASNAADPIKIGVVTPLSGTYAGIGQQVRWGLELATKEVNAAGGIMGRPVELCSRTRKPIPRSPCRRRTSCSRSDKVDFLTGTVNSGSTLAVGQVAERAGKLIATTVSFADSITGDQCSPNVFRVNARAGQQSAALAVWLSKEKPKAKRVLSRPGLRDGPFDGCGVQGERRESGRRHRRRSVRAARRKDYTQYFGQIRAARPQVLYTSVAGNDTVRLLTQLRSSAS